jgi:Holliday junction resolvase-like predicted endonuclease
MNILSGKRYSGRGYMRNNGKPLEETVSEILIDNGYSIIARNKRYSEPVSVEIDIICSDYLGREIFVECKSRNSKVGLDEYARFARIVNTYAKNTPFRYNAIMVTDNYFVPRVKYYAKQDKIWLIDRDGLEKLKEASRMGLKGLVMGFINGKNAYEREGLIGVAKYIMKRRMNVKELLKWNGKR